MDGNTEAPAPATLPSLLEQIKDAKSIVEFDKVEAGLQELESKYSGVVYNDIATKQGLARAKADRAAVREVRYEVQNLASDMKDPLNRLKKMIDGGAERIKARVLKVEEPIDAQIKAEEARIEAEKERKRQEAEALRKARQDKIDAMRNAATALVGQPAAKIAETLAEIQANEPTLDEFGDLAGSAMVAHGAAIGALTAMHAAAVQAEAQAAELAKLREETEARRKAEEAEAAGRAAKEAAELRQREADEQKAREEAAEAARAMAAATKAQLDAEREAREKSDAELAKVRAQLAAMQAAIEPPAPVVVPAVQWSEATRDAVLRQEPPASDVLVLSEGPVDAAAVVEAMQPTDADPGDEAAMAVNHACPPRDRLVSAVATIFNVQFPVAYRWLVETFGDVQ